MKATEQPSKRNDGIDLLRIVSMLMIVLLHTLGQSMEEQGLLMAARGMSPRYEVLWFLEIAAYGAADIYGLISGYVGYGRKPQLRKLLYLYLQVVFYTLGTTLVFAAVRGDAIGVRTLLAALFPFAYKTYWYFSAYFCLFFFLPFLNLLVERLERGAAVRLLMTVVLVLSVLPTVFRMDYAALSGGYSFVWLAVLYVVGACVKKFRFLSALSRRACLLLYGGCVLVGFFYKIGAEMLKTWLSGTPQYCDHLMNYFLPSVFLGALFLLRLFSDLKLCRFVTGLVHFFAPAAFGVYLFHTAPLILDTFFTGRFLSYLSLPTALLPLAVLTTACGIFLVSALVDRVRLLLFELLRVRQLCAFLEEKLQGVWRALLLRLKTT